ncbi:hypothetical protein Tco_1370543 [Tanacetum coccineum]
MLRGKSLTKVVKASKLVKVSLTKYTLAIVMNMQLVVNSLVSAQVWQIPAKMRKFCHRISETLEKHSPLDGSPTSFIDMLILLFKVWIIALTTKSTVGTPSTLP